MSLEDILRRVETTGREQAEAIAAASREQVAAQLAAARAEGEAAAAAIAGETERRVAAIERHELPAADLEVKRQRLETQRELLEATRRKALEQLAQLKPARLKQVYGSLLADAPTVGTLRCRPVDAKLLGELCALPQGDPIDEPGFVIETRDYRLDFRFATLVAQAWQEHLPAVNGALFGDV